MDFSNLNPLYRSYFVRLNLHPGYEEILLELTKSPKYPLFLIISHVGSKKENPHFHLIVQTLQKPGAFRAFLKSRFDKGKGNGHMSIKSWDGNNRAVQYLYHEEDCKVLCSKGFSQEFLDEQKDLATKFKEGKSKYTDALFEHILEVIDDPKKNCEFYSGNRWDERNICYAVWDVCRDEKKSYPNKYLLENIIRKIQAHLAITQAKELKCPDWDDTKAYWFDKMFGN